MSKSFVGGIHPRENKSRTENLSLKQSTPPPIVAIPFAQHIGKPSVALVKPGERVLRGQLIAEPSGPVSSCNHASVSGIVKGVVQIRHPLGFLVDALQIENDGLDEWASGCSESRDLSKLSPEEIKSFIKSAGIVGMGGAAFPTYVKLSPPAGKKVDTFIINGIECEPYLTADDLLMRETPDTIISGIILFLRAINAPRCIIGIEENKPLAVAALDAAIKKSGATNISIQVLPVMYPQGAEKQLIYAILKREVPSGGLPVDIGVIVDNVATVHAGYEACYYNRPLTERVVTVTGDGIANPANFWVRIGTMATHLLDQCGFDYHKTRKLITGGPMMGFPMRDLSWSIAKGTNGILALTNPESFDYSPCIRCSRCNNHCPMGLLPSEFSIFGESGNLLYSKDYNVRDCIECGICSYVCPSKRPIVQWIRMEKMELNRLAQLESKK